MAQFRTLRAEHQAARQQTLEEAQLLAQLAHSKGEPYDPVSDFPPDLLQIGSDFSTAGIRRLIEWRGPMAREVPGSGIPAAP